MLQRVSAAHLTVAPFITAVAIYSGAMGVAGRQWLFLIEALPAIAIGVYCLLRLTDNIQVSTWLQPEEKVVLVAELCKDEATAHAGSFKAAFQGWRVWVACLIYFASASGIYG